MRATTLGQRAAIAKCLMGFLMAAGAVGITSTSASAADNELTAEESAAGWQLLFNGENLDGWKNNNGEPVARGLVKDGTFNTYKCGGYVLVYDKPFGDFVLKCDVKMSEPECNSGVFFRVSDLKDPVMTGLEVQVFSGRGTTIHDFGAIYDLVAPTKNASKVGEWNQLEIRCEGPLVNVKVNGELVAEMNCDDFDKPGERLDGTKHKFGRAIKDFARSGYLGLQDHGHDAWYKNVKLLEL